MALWIICVRPFKSKANFYINFSNEIFLMTIFLTILLFQYLDWLFPYSSEIGWVLISLVCLAILQAWILLLPVIIKVFITKCSKKKILRIEEEEEEEITDSEKRIHTLKSRPLVWT